MQLISYASVPAARDMSCDLAIRLSLFLTFFIYSSFSYMRSTFLDVPQILGGANILHCKGSRLSCTSRWAGYNFSNAVARTFISPTVVDLWMVQINALPNPLLVGHPIQLNSWKIHEFNSHFEIKIILIHTDGASTIH